MSTIYPFAAIRYNTSSNTDLSARLAPPYDVLSDSDKQALLQRDPCNFVKIDLPHTPPKTAGPPEVYTGSRAQMDAWLADGTMVRDAAPGLYVYHQHYEYGGTSYVRRMFFARLKLEPFGSGSVFPHEQTFGGPKEDRLCLTKACEANLSPIFGLYPDAENLVAAELDAACQEEPLAVGTLDGVESRLWAVNDPGTLVEVEQLLREKPTFIADGHHRYGTGLLYRDWLIQEQGELREDHPANCVLCVFCAMEDPGLLILPTHRVLAGVKVDPALLAADAEIEVRDLTATDPSAVVAELAKHGPQAFACWSSADQKYIALLPKNPDVLKPLETDHKDAWCRLGLAFLHAYVLDRVVTPKTLGGQAPEIRYIKADAAAIDTARETNGTAFLMQPTTMAEMQAVCQAGDLMPQKSTFFYPKLASGLVINPLSV